MPLKDYESTLNIKGLPGTDMPSSYKIINQEKFSNQPTGNFLGGDFDFLRTYLKDVLKTGLPNKELTRQTAYGNIGKAVEGAATKTKENLAASGMLRSGAGQSTIAGIYGQEAGAKAEFETDLAGQEQNYISQQIGRLLGLNQFEGESKFREQGANRDYSLALQQLGLSREQFEFMKKNYPSELMQLLGGVLGAGAQVGAAAIGAGGGTPTGGG